MEEQGFGESKVMGWVVVAIDTLLAVVCLFATELLLGQTNPMKMATSSLTTYIWVVVVCYLLSSVWLHPVVCVRNIRFYRVMEHTLLKVVVLGLLVTTFLFVLKDIQLLRFFFSTFLIVFFFVLLIVRLIEHRFFYYIYGKEENKRHVLVVAPNGLRNLGHAFLSDNEGMIEAVLSNEAVDTDKLLPDPCTEEKVVACLDAHPEINMLLFVPGDSNSNMGPVLVHEARNRMMNLYILPDIAMGVDVSLRPVAFGDTWLISTARYPLQDIGNRFLKRSFDIVCSLLFLVTLYPIIYVVVFIVIKIQSPGPVYFTQRRSGLNGKEFTCIKFRSMHVNDQADKLQATKDDPRKFPFGNFMRRMNIDELPQLICVLKGDMSLVGPRPHMLAHTEQYRKLVDEYMMRHMAKPGLSGWAQVTGFRGETKELSQMEGRVKKDIWYIENWSMGLDIFIIFKTLWNVITQRDTMAY